MFKDAVCATRKLGIRYLWIDSLCIIQGSDGDFNQEAKRVEDVFSSAYCALAAGRAQVQHSAFLQKHPRSKYVTFQHKGEEPFYVCEPMDDFNRDVFEGHLNSRG